MDNITRINRVDEIAILKNGRQVASHPLPAPPTQSEIREYYRQKGSNRERNRINPIYTPPPPTGRPGVGVQASQFK